MTELKTLKDIKFHWGYIDSDKGDILGDLDIKKQLKAEVVKRAKQCIRNIKDKHYKTFNKGRLWEIMDFNNLTPEDLQEVN